ncbi:hypothetical protein H924_11025 [Corynebacterium callunae DSM 20147]|uniref:Uncharacterized protein n=2 Tax=Corynebacterium callunae TaxID=1721 RepID=M1V075_9CORY|nr:hypothetical protein H924_11025 [Corynebacterium callunae DSM 20147]
MFQDPVIFQDPKIPLPRDIGATFWKRDLRHFHPCKLHQPKQPLAGGTLARMTTRLSIFRTQVLAALDKPMTPVEVAEKIGSTPQRTKNALWHLAKNGLIERSFYGVYAPIEVSA